MAKGALDSVQERRPTFLVGTVDCNVQEDFEYNGDFNVLRGAEFFKDGELAFPEGEESLDGTYRTMFGFGAAHNGMIYRNSNHNVKFAMRRLTNKRLVKDSNGNLIKGYHERLFDNQRKFLLSRREFFDAVGKQYEKHFSEYGGSENEAREHHGDTHAKRLLRLQAWKELEEENRCVDPTDPWVKSVLWKMKKDEWAKPGKKPRMIADLGVSASLRGFRLTEYLKIAQEKESIHVNGGELYFCKKPDPLVLKAVFEKLINPPGRFFFVYFSDDSCLSIRKDDGTIDMYNLDISSCDASHGPELFNTLERVVPPECRADMALLVKQCTLPLRLVSRVNRKHKVILQPTRPMLFTGSTITTGINNLANLSIGLAISEAVYQGPETIRLAAERAGYIVTGCKPLANPEDLQFLKHSPVLDENHEYQPMLNLGVLIRASGVCRGDLPGRGPLKQRAVNFQKGLLNGAYPHTSFEILDAMKAQVKSGQAVDTHVFDEKVVLNADFKPFRARTSSIRKRYNLSDLEYQEVLEFAHNGFEEFSNSKGVSKILELDYGLVCIAQEHPDYGKCAWMR